MNSKNILNVLLFSLLLTSCSSLKDSIALGSITGASLGAIGGKTLSHKNADKNAQISAAGGAVLGGVISYIIYGSLIKRDARVRKKTLFNLENFGASTPHFNQSQEKNYFFPSNSLNQKTKRR